MTAIFDFTATDSAAIGRELELAVYATAEIEALLAVLGREVSEAADELGLEHSTAMRSLLRRIRKLNSVTMSVVSREGRDFDEMHREVHDEPADALSAG